MITDRLSHASLYRTLSARIAAAFDYVTSHDFTKMADGRYDLEGDHMFALVQRYATKPISEGRWEAHRKYIDLQLVVSGTEQIGYVSLDQLAAEPYDESRDLIWLSGEAGQWITVPSGHFMLLWPSDAHMPQIAAGAPADVLKVVVKIDVSNTHPHGGLLFRGGLGGRRQ
ncbi:MAG: YhcH/YjgK/YiaL family protein [Acidobacteriota bacterium]